MNKNSNDYLVEYNELLSQAAFEQNGKFSFLASPTLNKQETITFLYKDIINQPKKGPRKNLKHEIFGMYLGFIPRVCLMFFRLFRTSLKFRIKSLPENFIYVRTWLVPRSLKDSKLIDDYFRILLDELAVNHKIVAAFQPLKYDNLLYRFDKAQKPENYIIPVGLLSLFDILSILWEYIFSAKVILKKKYFFKTVEVTDHINHSLKVDYFKLRSFQAYLDLAIARKLKKQKPKILLYVFENQAWENAYLHVFNNTKTRTIGYQSSGFSLRFLNFFPSKIDNRKALFPDKILTVGDNFKNTMMRYGNYPVTIETFGALRFDFPVIDNCYKIHKPSKKIYKRILYAFPVHFYQYRKITNDLIDVFQNYDIEVFLKYHPLYQNNIDENELPKNFKICSKIVKEKLKSTYDLVLFNDNSFGIESLIMGVKSYEYEFGEFYNENRLFDFELYEFQVNKNRLKSLRDEILDATLSKKLNEKYIQQYIGNMYSVYSGKHNQIFV